ncbi:hypothetical protein ACVXHB_31430 [Escherichia coli]
MLTVVTGRYTNPQNNGSRVMAHARRKIHDVHARAPTYITTEARSVSVNCMPSRQRSGALQQNSVWSESDSCAHHAVTV